MSMKGGQRSKGVGEWRSILVNKSNSRIPQVWFSKTEGSKEQQEVSAEELSRWRRRLLVIVIAVVTCQDETEKLRQKTQQGPFIMLQKCALEQSFVRRVTVITLLPRPQSFFLFFLRTSSSTTCSMWSHTSSSLPPSSCFTSGDSSSLTAVWLVSCSSLLETSRQLRRDFR